MVKMCRGGVPATAGAPPFSGVRLSAESGVMGRRAAALGFGVVRTGIEQGRQLVRSKIEVSARRSMTRVPFSVALKSNLCHRDLTCARRVMNVMSR
jgi:hypothetical protein